MWFDTFSQHDSLNKNIVRIVTFEVSCHGSLIDLEMYNGFCRQGRDNEVEQFQ
jgi:hypothetical protein